MADKHEPHQIVAEIDTATGAVSLKVVGVAGPGCKAVTAPFERLFGGEKVDVETAEYHQPAQATQRATLGGGDG